MNPHRWASVRRSPFDVAGPGLFRHRMRVAAPLVAQSALLAGGAWWIAQSLFDHRTPIFAATAALICLTAGLGGRGRQAVDLWVGVLIGVVVGQGLRALDSGTEFWLIAPAIALAMSMVALLDPRPLAYIQSGAAVLIVVAVEASSSPTAYLLDAAVGGGLGLLGSQVLFTPDPMKLVAGPVREILRDLATALGIAAEALRAGVPARAGTACEHAREAHARLGALSHARVAAHRVTARTVRGRRRAARVRQTDPPLDDIDVLVAAVLLLCEDVRAQLASRPAPTTGALPQRLTELADGMTELAARPLPSTPTPASTPLPPPAPQSPARPGGLTEPPHPEPPHPEPPHPEPTLAIEIHLRDARAALHRLRGQGRRKVRR